MKKKVKKPKLMDPWLDKFSFISLLLTVIFFGVALFEKGFTHDLLLEAGVFLVSVKLVLSARKQELQIQELDRKITSLLENRSPRNSSKNQ